MAVLPVPTPDDRAAHAGTRTAPRFLVVGEVVAVGDPDATIDGHPAHQLAVDVLLALAADLPDRRVRLLPTADGDLDDVAELLPQRVADHAAESRVHVRAVEHFAIDVELQLMRRGVADAYRSRSAVPL